MSMTAALRDRAKADAGVTAKVGTRVFRDQRIQGSDLPAITLAKISDPLDYTYDGPQGLRDTLVQWDVWAESRGDCDETGDALIDAVTPAGVQGGISFDQSFVEADVDSSERTETETIYRRRIDIRTWWSQA